MAVMAGVRAGICIIPDPIFILFVKAEKYASGVTAS
jgi:hypothetical protein